MEKRGQCGSDVGWYCCNSFVKLFSCSWNDLLLVSCLECMENLEDLTCPNTWQNLLILPIHKKSLNDPRNSLKLNFMNYSAKTEFRIRENSGHCEATASSANPLHRSYVPNIFTTLITIHFNVPSSSAVGLWAERLSPAGKHFKYLILSFHCAS